MPGCERNCRIPAVSSKANCPRRGHFRSAPVLGTLAEDRKVRDCKTAKDEDMTRTDAIAGARQQLHSGEFLAELSRRVGYRTESQNPGSGDALRAYLEEGLQPAFAQLDFSSRLI